MPRYRLLLPVIAVALSQLAAPIEAGASLPDAPPSTAVATASLDTHEAVGTSSDGDLWPSCWSNDDNLYAANGDGKGFTTTGPFADITVNRIEGRPPNLSGATLAQGDAVGSVWSGGGYTRKPTGMACVDGTIYLAVQDLSLSFNDVPAATIVKSTDHGRTWTWDRSKPMFDNHVFTTIWFADFGKDSAWAPDRYLYAYGLDHNWRDSFDDTVPDPTDVYLARVPRDRVQDRRAWDFYTGADNRGRPRWSGNIADRAPVLHDGRRVYQQVYSANRISNLTVVSQGSVTYDKPLQRYIYTSWSEYTFEFYESPTPWGPWKRFLSKDFGGYPWTANQHGGYATTIPSKFLSADGLSMWVQANVCPCANAGTSVYHYSLRKLTLGLAAPGGATNNPDPSANLARSTGVVPISKSARDGDLRVLNDGALTGSVNDFDDEVKSASWWGYTWPRKYRMNQVEFTTGDVSAQGGWFVGRPSVQLRQNGEWTNATAQTVSPVYPGDSTAGPNQTYTISFLPADADGVRVIGVPGGTRTFSSAAEVTARYLTQVANGGFESPPGGPSAWAFEGNAGHGVDAGLGFAHSGANNGWIRGSGTGWSALTQQVPVAPGKTYTFSAWVRSSPALTDARFGVRSGATVLGETKFGATADYTLRQVTITVPANTNTVTVYTGFFGPGTDTWIQIDDITSG
ncbi:carbohydrate binding domain-containing protein [Actinocrispum wychmicini]|uniref:Carbohydrate binding protein n=1 Tax=Actinocrispum wychmicini TaxID=1213861 RepID=A0A4V2S663_9PSEU|nr:carbohydrate binding domain-containing protein [Actinocrispum wychmicini]TCO54760.1 carbohydrate binding protein [Actinocrispum wychmicini]